MKFQDILPDPIAYFANTVQVAHMMAEAQMVIGMRLMGMAGIWSVPPAEDARMVSEKMHAVTRSATDAGHAMMRGETPDKITAAAIKPLRQKTRANAKRLGKRGLKRT
jgi:hypothetical protein